MAFLIGLVAVGLAALPVMAQDEPEVSDDMIEQAMERSFEGEVTVTGSLIPRADLTALSPVTVLEVPQELTYSGIVRIEDLIVQMPQAFAGQNSTVANGASGTATIDLRRLGTNRTLVLINGRRLPPGDVSSYAPDINVIPASLVKRVDILTGGASTVYGSDAMAGVVNFVLDTDFEGVRGGVQYATYQHNNNNAQAQAMNEARGFDVPTGSTWDGQNVNVDLAVGGKFADGKGHASAYIGYRKIDELVKGSRDYLNCAPTHSSTGPACGGSATTPWGTFFTDEGTYMIGPTSEGYDGHSFNEWDGRRFNYGPTNHVQRPDEKWNAGAFVNYEINKHFDVYLEVMYMNNHTEAQIAPSGNFWNTDFVNCDNPMLSEQQHALICTDPQGPEGYANVGILRRNIEGAPRSNTLGHVNIRLVAGMRGAISDNWNYDLYYLKGQNNSYDSYNNDLSIQRVTNAIDVIEDPDTGEWVCRTDQANCVPWNIFQEGGVTQDAIDYITTKYLQWGITSTQIFNLTLTSDWENYGIAIPSASEGVQIAVGAEYREESLNKVTDEVYSQGGSTGSGGAQPPIRGGINVKEAFIELLIPLIQDVKLAQDLSLELGYRYSDYSTSGGVSTYKVQASWAPTQSWRFRAGYNRAIRAANLSELYLPQGYNLGGSDDPCAGENPTATLEQCMLTGMTAAQYGTGITWNPAGQYNTFQGGNPDLDPETADTITAGVVWTPQSIRGLSITLDYFNIAIDERIGTLGFASTMNSCLNTGDPDTCALIERDALGTLWKPNAGRIVTTLQNIGKTVAEGVDLNFNYLLGLGNAGYLAMDLNGSYMLTNDFENPVTAYDCVGYFGFICGDETADWRHRMRATWESNFRFNVSLAWRYLGGVDQDLFSDNPDLAGSEEDREYEVINGMDAFPSYNWFDLAASYTFRGGVKLTVGVNNILDEEPPLGPDFADDPNFTLHGSYDPLGRYVFGSVQFNF